MENVGARLIVALDFAELPPALALAEQIGPRVGMLKVGLELFNAAGPGAITSLRELGFRVFYDCKLHDIPNTVAGAAAAAGRLGVSMLNVHTLGGRAMMKAAREGAYRGAREGGLEVPLVIAVTILTSLEERDLREELGLPESPREAVLRLAGLAREAGLDGVICSVHEVQDIKRRCGRDFLAVTPGVRPMWAATGDQARFATPEQALAAGADYLVIGRPITRAARPAEALERILEEMAG